MALMFQRLAHNFIKNGYFPTDEVTLARINAHLDVGASKVRIYDPCCGEGTALAELKHHLTQCGATAQAIGVEFDSERAWHAKGLLDTAIHADVHDVMVSQRSMGLLLLNPPYGAVVSDKAALNERDSSDRLEKVFARHTFQSLQFGGDLVLIVPIYVIDTEFASLIARNFTKVRIYMAPEQRFKQCVIFGVKRRSDSPDPALVKRLVAANQNGEVTELPEMCVGEPYEVPLATPDANFAAVSLRVEAKQLDAEIKRLAKSTLWPRFAPMFCQTSKEHRRPLKALSRWHLALALAAGQINGIVKSKDGRTLLIKGDTFKEKAVTVEMEEGANGSFTERRILTDRFVPTIRAIDFTPGESYGQVWTVK